MVYAPHFAFLYYGSTFFVFLTRASLGTTTNNDDKFGNNDAFGNEDVRSMSSERE